MNKNLILYGRQLRRKNLTHTIIKMIKLNSIEKLQLIAMKDNDYFSIKNKLYCLLSQLHTSNKLVFKDKKYSVVESDKDELNVVYEEEFCRLLKYKMYFELKKFIINIHFKPTLIRHGLIRRHVQKSRFKIFNKEIYEKTEEFYIIYNKIMEESYNRNVINIICNNTKEDENIKLLVDKIVLQFSRLD